MKYKFILGMIFCATAYADQVYCPDGIHLVNIGASVQEFTSVCGNPSSSSSSNAPGSAMGYYVWTYNNQYPGRAMNPMNGIPTQVHFIIENGKVGAIQTVYAGHAQSAQSFACPMQNVQVGATTDQVKLFCGPPSSTQQLTHLPGNTQQALPETKVLQYQQNSMTASYTFVNGQLTGKN